MAFALLIIGILLLVSSIRNTQDNLKAILIKDFTGSGNFGWWVVALLIIGAVGYINRLKGLSDAFLVLVILALFLSRGNPSSPGGGFFNQFTTALGFSNSASGGVNTAVSAASNLIGGSGITIGSPGTGVIITP